jgi:hypothetical protein
VQVDVEVGSGSEALDQRDGATLAFIGLESGDSLPAHGIAWGGIPVVLASKGLVGQALFAASLGCVVAVALRWRILSAGVRGLLRVRGRRGLR